MLRRVFILMLPRWRSYPIKYRLRDCQPITERLQSISLESHLSEQNRFIGREKHNAICIFEPKFLGKFLTDKPFSWVLLIPSSCWRSSEWQLMSMIRMISSWISAIFNPIIFAPYLRIMNIHECTLICPYAHTVHLMFQSSLCNRNTINMDKKVPESSLYWGVVCWQN